MIFVKFLVNIATNVNKVTNVNPTAGYFQNIHMIIIEAALGLNANVNC